ncbi:exopolysaccharide biosynthesis polyprenyl glycosylphosphotransferase [Nakamurella sp. UYEF19]
MGTLSSRVSRDPDSLPFIALTIFLACAWMIALHWGGTRDPEVVGHGPEEYKRLVQTSFGLFGLVAISSYVFNLHLPRAYVLVTLPAGLVALLLSRFTWRRWLHSHRLNGDYMSMVLVVGNLRTVRELLTDLRRAPLAGYGVLGVCIQQNSPTGELSLDPDTGARMVDGVPVLGGLEDVAATAQRFGADTVAVTSTASFGPAAVRRLSWELEKTDIQLVLAPALTNIAGPRIHTKPVAGLPLIHVDRPTYRGANRIVKRSFDWIGSAAILALASPFFLGLMAAVKLSSPGPIFFRQERVGLNGKTFRMIKFRSMVVDAEARLADLKNQQRDAGNDTLFKMRNDPRVTKVGKFIRRFSLDEVPQLINVLKGDMSLVGPRPPLMDEVATYHGEARLRLLVRPGMTGLWQVSGRSTLNWEDTVRLDTYYVENWSLTSDLVILWKTAKAVLSASGAY